MLVPGTVAPASRGGFRLSPLSLLLNHLHDFNRRHRSRRYWRRTDRFGFGGDQASRLEHEESTQASSGEVRERCHIRFQVLADAAFVHTRYTPTNVKSRKQKFHRRFPGQGHSISRRSGSPSPRQRFGVRQPSAAFTGRARDGSRRVVRPSAPGCLPKRQGAAALRDASGFPPPRPRLRR